MSILYSVKLTHNPAGRPHPGAPYTVLSGVPWKCAVAEFQRTPPVCQPLICRTDGEGAVLIHSAPRFDDDPATLRWATQEALRALLPHVHRIDTGAYPTPQVELARWVVSTCLYAGWTDTNILADPAAAVAETIAIT